MPIVFKSAKSQENLGETDCLRGLNLLGHAQMIELLIGSSCGGHGICGGDRVRVDPALRSRFSPPSEVEMEHLTERELTDGWRLACQCYPAEDGLSFTVEVKTPGV